MPLQGTDRSDFIGTSNMADAAIYKLKLSEKAVSMLRSLKTCDCLNTMSSATCKKVNGKRNTNISPSV
jgi:hypothetical protein